MRTLFEMGMASTKTDIWRGVRQSLEAIEERTSTTELRRTRVEVGVDDSGVHDAQCARSTQTTEISLDELSEERSGCTSCRGGAGWWSADDIRALGVCALVAKAIGFRGREDATRAWLASTPTTHKSLTGLKAELLMIARVPAWRQPDPKEDWVLLGPSWVRYETPVERVDVVAAAPRDRGALALGRLSTRHRSRGDVEWLGSAQPGDTPEMAETLLVLGLEQIESREGLGALAAIARKL